MQVNTFTHDCKQACRLFYWRYRFPRFIAVTFSVKIECSSCIFQRSSLRIGKLKKESVKASARELLDLLKSCANVRQMQGSAVMALRRQMKQKAVPSIALQEQVRWNSSTLYRWTSLCVCVLYPTAFTKRTLLQKAGIGQWWKRSNLARLQLHTIPLKYLMFVKICHS